MSQAAEAHDAWADVPVPPSRPRREADSWASAEELEVLGGLGEPRVADWTVLTLEREEEEPEEPIARRFAREADGEPDVVAHMAAPAVALEPVAPALPVRPEPESWLEPAHKPGQRRTVVIRGHGDERARPLVAAERRRPARRASERVGHRPDRVAMWAFGLGLLLILVAVLSAAN